MTDKKVKITVYVSYITKIDFNGSVNIGYKMVRVDGDILLADFEKKKSQYDSIEVRGCIVKSNDVWQNFVTVIMPINKGEKREPITYEYTDIILFKRYATVESFAEMFRSIITTKKVALDGLPEYTAPNDYVDLSQWGYTDFIPSHISYGILNLEWPAISYEVRSSTTQPMNQPRLTVKKELPVYPTLDYAIRDIVGLSYQNVVLCNLFILLPNYAISTKLVVHSRKEIDIHLEANDNLDLLCKYYCRFEDEVLHEEQEYKDGKDLKLKFPKEIVELWVYIFDSDGALIDLKWWNYPPYNSIGGVIIANDSEEYWKGIIESGESYYVEFKNSLHRSDKYNHDDFLESVISFSNSEGGVIIIGVGDNGEMNGINEGEIPIVYGLIEQLVYSRIDGKTEINRKTMAIDGKKYVVVEVEAGKEAPYFFKGTLQGYIRRGTTDKLIDKYTLESIKAQRQKQSGLGWG